MQSNVATSSWPRPARSALQLLFAAAAAIATIRCSVPAEMALQDADPEAPPAAVEPPPPAARLEATTGQWSPVITWPQSAVHTHLLPTGKVLFTSEFAFGDAPLIWDPSTDQIVSAPGVDYNPFCAGHSFLADGRLLVAGGHNDRSHFGLSYASLFDPFTSTWSRIPPMNGPRWYPTSAALPSGEALVLAGETNGADADK